MANITIATFNCENLFQRFKFGSKVKQTTIDNAIKNGFIVNKELFMRINDEERKFTASAIKDTGADIIVLQEVENLDTLKTFQSRFVKKYPYQYLIDGNDPRLIDVAVLSKFEAKQIRTHQFDKKGSSKIFSRDCLEIEYDINGTSLTLFVNHFKSMLGGRAQTMARRKTQAEQVVKIVKDRFGSNPANKRFVVLGDLNDYLPSSGLEPLLSQTWLENVIERLPVSERWTHWYDSENSVSQLDYILLSTRLSQDSTSKPVIIRKGLPRKALQYTGARYPGIGDRRPSASDHCALAMTIKI